MKPNKPTKLQSNETNNFRKLSKSGRKIYFDFGANDGASFDYFLSDPKKKWWADFQGDGTFSLQGKGFEGGWTVIAFEANPNFKDVLESVKARPLYKPPNTEIILNVGVAVSDTSGFIDLWLDSDEKGKGGSSGSSIMSGSSATYHNNSVKIPVMGIIDIFHKYHITRDDYIIMKVDIEGAEFKMLRKMVTHNLLHLVDILAVEWHMGDTEKKCLKWITEDMPHLKWERWD